MALWLPAEVEVCSHASSGQCLQCYMQKNTTFGLAFNLSFGDEGASHISELLKTNSVLTELSLGMCGIHPAGATKLSQALMINTVLKSLCLAGNRVC